MDLLPEITNDSKSKIASSDLKQSSVDQSIVNAAPLIWNLTLYDQRRYGKLFTGLTGGNDFLSCLSARNFLLEKGTLVKNFDHIWNLCDPDGKGKLTIEQFTVFMWLVVQCIRGVAIPECLCKAGMPERYAIAVLKSNENYQSDEVRCESPFLISNADELETEIADLATAVTAAPPAEEELMNDFVESEANELLVESPQNAEVEPVNEILNWADDDQLLSEDQNANNSVAESMFKETIDEEENKNLLVIHTLKHFQKQAEQFNEILFAQEQHILQVHEQNNSCFLKLKGLREEMISLQEKSIDVVKQIRQAIFELKNRDFSNSSIEDIIGNNTNDSFKLGSQNSNSTTTTTNPFEATNDTYISFDSNQSSSSFSKSTNPFRETSQKSTIIYGPHIGMDTLRTPLLPSKICDQSIQNSMQSNEKFTDCNGHISSASSELEISMSSLKLNSNDDKQDGYEHLSSSDSSKGSSLSKA